MVDMFDLQLSLVPGLLIVAVGCVTSALFI
jgi:hypothetical protein